MSANKKKAKPKSYDQIAGVGMDYKVGDAEYFFSPVKIGRLLGTMAAKVRGEGLNSVSALQMPGNPGAKRDIIARTSILPVTQDMCIEWLDTFDGSVWIIEESLRPKHPEINAAVIRDWDDDHLTDVAELVTNISGFGGEPDDPDASRNGKATGNPTAATPSGATESPSSSTTTE